MKTREKEIEVNEGNEKERESIDSLLTEKQLRVLQLRSEGSSQQEVAEIIGTSRSNVSILEKRAYHNISWAERTLQQWMMIHASISLKVNAGTDVFELPSLIFRAADEKDIQLPINSLDIIVQLRCKAANLFRRRAICRNVEIYVTVEGEVFVQVSAS